MDLQVAESEGVEVRARGIPAIEAQNLMFNGALRRCIPAAEVHVTHCPGLADTVACVTLLILLSVPDIAAGPAACRRNDAGWMV